MDQSRIIHVAQDEKFINAAIYQFEAVAPGRNLFFILLNNIQKPLKYVTPQPIVQIAENSEEGKHKLVSKVSDRDVVIFHSLSPRFYDIVFSLPSKAKTVWFCFGYEIYNDKKYFNQRSIFGPHTIKRFYEPKVKPVDQRIKDYFKPFLRNFKSDIPLTSSEKKTKAIKRIDYLCSSFKEEFEVICEKIGQEKKFFNYWYYPLEQIVDIYASYQNEKSAILVGNSGFSTGNHLDVFEGLIQKDVSHFNEVIVPLSYGHAPYTNEILALGTQYLGERFHPLTEFMPLADYNKLLAKAGIAIFYNIRQQALGNIIALLWMGSKIFLSKQNVIYDFMVRNGIVIYSYEDHFLEKNSLQLLTKEEIENNRAILQAILNEKHLLATLKQQLDAINASI